MVDETFSAPIFGAQCPIPIEEYPTIVMAHGGGGRLTQMLIDKMFVPTFSNPALTALGDGAVLDAGGARLAFSTDSFVISPIFFPGGDIGSLAGWSFATSGSGTMGTTVGTTTGTTSATTSGTTLGPLANTIGGCCGAGCSAGIASGRFAATAEDCRTTALLL